MRFLLLMLAWLIAAPALADPRAPDLVLSGQITGADHQTYKPVVFETPAGVTRLTIDFDYTGRDQKTVVDLGLLDPERFRGWSGGNKSQFTVSTQDATAGYLPGPVRPGRWTLLLGVPNARPGSVATYEAKVFFDRGDLGQGFAAAPLKAEAGWYRGDLHLHTGHSDGSCLSQAGLRAPCPLYRTVEAAAARGLDFIAITDHNTTAQYEAMRELQPAFDRLLLVPGREITTFQGHANVFGPTTDIDFRLGDPTVPDMNSLARAAARAGGLMSINHPASPSGEVCMGCGWTAKTDYALFGAVEIINGGAMRASGGSAEGPLSGVPFWEARLNAGLRLTGVGGSDNHDALLPATTPGAVGSPATVVHAQALSTPAIVQGLREGRVFVDLDTAPDHRLDLHATRGDQTADMGGRLAARAGEAVTFVVQVVGVADGRVEVVRDGKVAAVDLTAPADPQARLFKIVSDGRRGWVRINVRAADGRLLMIGNPIYLN